MHVSKTQLIPPWKPACNFLYTAFNGASKIHPSFPAGIPSGSTDGNVSRQNQNVADFCTVASGSGRRIGLRIRERHPRGLNHATPGSGPGCRGKWPGPAGLSAPNRTTSEETDVHQDPGEVQVPRADWHKIKMGPVVNDAC